MKKYEYVTLTVKNNPVKDATLSGYKEIINEYVEKGYRYAGYIPKRFGPSGKVIELDLIFETEV